MSKQKNTVPNGEIPKGVSEEVWIEATGRGDAEPTIIFAPSWERACLWAKLLVEHNMVPACLAIRKASCVTPTQTDLILHTRTFRA